MNEESVSKEYRAFLEFLYSTESKALHGTLFEIYFSKCFFTFDLALSALHT